MEEERKRSNSMLVNGRKEEFTDKQMRDWYEDFLNNYSGYMHNQQQTLVRTWRGYVALKQKIKDFNFFLQKHVVEPTSQGQQLNMNEILNYIAENSLFLANTEEKVMNERSKTDGQQKRV